MMSLEQARRLAQRLPLAEVADSSARLQRLLGKAMGMGAYMAWRRESASGTDRLTINMSPEQAAAWCTALPLNGTSPPFAYRPGTDLEVTS